MLHGTVNTMMTGGTAGWLPGGLALPHNKVALSWDCRHGVRARFSQAIVGMQG
jgi:hypothetical protein